jgi:hypothetical protein
MPTIIILCLVSITDSSCPGVLLAHDTIIIEGICLHNDSDEVGSFEFPIIVSMARPLCSSARTYTFANSHGSPHKSGSTAISVTGGAGL